MKTKARFGALGLGFLLALGAEAQVSVTTVVRDIGLNEPYGVVVDADDNFFITDSVNNQIVRLDGTSLAASTLAGIPFDPPGSDDGPAYIAHFNTPQGLLLIGGLTNSVVTNGPGLLVADTGNNLIRFVTLSDGTVYTLAGQTFGGAAQNATGLNATFSSPVGMVQDPSGNVYIADAGNSAIRVLNLNDPAIGITNLVVTGTSFNHLTAFAFAGTNQLWVADTGNQMVKLLTLSFSTNGFPTNAVLTTQIGTLRTSGTNDFSYGARARFNGPSGLLWVNGVGLLISDTLNHTLRLATNYTLFGPTNFAVTTFAGTPGVSGFVDAPALTAKFNRPVSIAQDSFHNPVLADLKNNAIRRIQIGPALAPVPTPQIGYVEFNVDPATGAPLSVLKTDQPFVFVNEPIIAIKGTSSTETFYTVGPTPDNPLVDTVPNPPTDPSSSQAPAYADGWLPSQVHSISRSPATNFTIKAVGVQLGRQNSPITSAQFRFVTATPNINGDNAASFNVTSLTTNALIYYTAIVLTNIATTNITVTNSVSYTNVVTLADNILNNLTNSLTDPTNGSPQLVPSSGLMNALPRLPVDGAMVFKVRAFRGGYADSGISSKIFYASNSIANRISFGFANGEASSVFIASPGQTFYAPVTLSVLPQTQIYSLQFNLTVIGAISGSLGFKRMLMKKDDPSEGPTIAPYTNNYVPTATAPQVFVGIPPGMFESLSGGFTNLTFTNTLSTTNLLGVGWLERKGITGRLFDTLAHDLTKYSIAHDTLFDEANGSVVLGMLSFQVPTNGQTPQIQIGRPSATSDGVGAPGSSVFISTPTNGSLSAGPINSIKNISLGQPKYIAGDCAPFGWFNAGDFGNTSLDNSDVAQIFQSACYRFDIPPPGSDFFDSMDSSGYTFTTNSNGYLEKNTAATGLLDGNDLAINQIGFGDGKLDTTDVYVTFRRSLDPSLLWFRRFWTNGVRVAETTPNVFRQRLVLSGSKGSYPPHPLVLSSDPPSVHFTAKDFVAGAGQTLQIPITAQVFGPYPVRVLMLNLTVSPLDGSPPLTVPVLFTPNPALGQPTLSSSLRSGNYAAAWLDSTIPGLTNTALVGTLTVQIPNTAPANAAYAVHFDHASASPNGLGTIPQQTLTGLITLSDRSASSFGDGIPDSWRLRYFGSISNLLSQAGADADGDGANNWQEFVAGTDPTDPASCLQVSTTRSAAQSRAESVIHWPSVTGKQYLVERSTSLFGADWVSVSTNIGTGTDIEFRETTGGSIRFYRVQPLP